ncbi:MAG: glycosyltransferase [Dysgonamonadaceae bacterium]|jgi:glycosyltransferase involved in cell wall biosynthesis|nr:glycosyltransferase [Dysgonamonadaceae bacterium]
MKITVSVTNDLLTDQRVHKVCSTLAQNNYEVVLVGRKLKANTLPDRGYKTKRMRLLFRRSFLFYAEYNIRLFLYLLVTRTDAYLSNDTDTLPANFLASLIRRKPLIFDAHEMFPEAPEIVDRPIVKWVWTKIEDLIFPFLLNSYTVCQSIADSYNNRYGINMQVVRNIPSASSSPATTERPIKAVGKKILLYQGAVNEGRGLEYIIAAMNYLDKCVLYIVGDGDIVNELKKTVEKAHLDDKVFFTGRVPFEELPAYTRCADIGINLLENRGLNYFYSLPNRLFDFIRANIPSLSSNFPEIRKIVLDYKIGALADSLDPEDLAENIRKMLAKRWPRPDFNRANADLSWENETQRLMNVVNLAFGNDV